MADLSQLIQYEKTHPVKPTIDGVATGFTVNIVSFDSERVSKALARLDAEKWELSRANEGKELTREQRYDFAVKQINEMIIASIESWDFGGNTFGDLAADAECNEENKRYLIGHPNAKWLRDSIFGAGGEIRNFFGELPKPSKKK